MPFIDVCCSGRRRSMDSTYYFHRTVVPHISKCVSRSQQGVGVATSRDSIDNLDDHTTRHSFSSALYGSSSSWTRHGAQDTNDRTRLVLAICITIIVPAPLLFSAPTPKKGKSYGTPYGCNGRQIYIYIYIAAFSLIQSTDLSSSAIGIDPELTAFQLRASCSCPFRRKCGVTCIRATSYGYNIKMTHLRGCSSLGILF